MKSQAALQIAAASYLYELLLPGSGIGIPKIPTPSFHSRKVR